MGKGFGFGSSSSDSTNISKSESAAQSQQQSGLTPEQILAAYNKVLPKLVTSLGTTTAALTSPDGAGYKAATSGNELMRELNPEYYSALKTASEGAQKGVDASGRLINAVDLTGLSPGEYNATERALNQDNTRTGNAGLSNPMNVIKNAMNFGGAFNNKLGILQNAIGANSSATGAASGVAGAASPSVSGFNAYTAATGGGDTFANNFLNAITRRSTGASQASSQSSQYGKSDSDSMNGSCCFIFMEAYKGPLPLEVRRFRDKYYRLKPSIATGYKKMAKWLVPLMRDYSLIRNLVWNFMIGPATKYCQNPKRGFNRTISHTWLRIWAIYGKV